MGDKDKNSMLSPEELFPLLLTLSNTHQLALDVEQCKNFAAIFISEPNGAINRGLISRKEFVNFARFLMIMGYLHGERGKVLTLALSPTHVDQPARPTAPCPDANAKLSERPAHQQSDNVQAPLRSDVDYYRSKSEILLAENDSL